MDLSHTGQPVSQGQLQQLVTEQYQPVSHDLSSFQPLGNHALIAPGPQEATQILTNADLHPNPNEIYPQYLARMGHHAIPANVAWMIWQQFKSYCHGM